MEFIGEPGWKVRGRLPSGATDVQPVSVQLSHFGGPVLRSLESVVYIGSAGVAARLGVPSRPATSRRPPALNCR